MIRRITLLLILFSLSAFLAIFLFFTYSLNEVRDTLLKRIGLETGLAIEASAWDLSFRPQPRVRLSGVSVAARAWGQASWTIQAKTLELAPDILSVLKRKPILRSLRIQGGRLAVRNPADLKTPERIFPFELKLGAPRKDEPIEFHLKAPGNKSYPSIEISGRVLEIRQEAGKRFPYLVAEGTGRISEAMLPGFYPPIKALEFPFRWDGDSLSIEKGHAAWGKGHVDFSLRVEALFQTPVFQTKIAVRSVEGGIRISDLAGKRKPGVPAAQERRLYGMMNADADLIFEGKSPSDWRRTLKGSGQIELTQGILTGTNILAHVFDKMSSLPIVGRSLWGFLAGPDQSLLKRKDLRIELAQSRFSIDQGEIRFDTANFVSDEFFVNGSGYLSFQGGLKLNGVLSLSPKITGALVYGIPEFGLLRDLGGRMVLPFFIGGSLQNPHVMVDREHLLSRFVVLQGQRVLKRVIDTQELF